MKIRTQSQISADPGRNSTDKISFFFYFFLFLSIEWPHCDHSKRVCWTDDIIIRRWCREGVTDDVLSHVIRSGTAEKFRSLSSSSNTIFFWFIHLFIDLIDLIIRYSVIYLQYIYRSFIYSFHSVSSLHQLVVKSIYQLIW
jgi:hypothetical protein